MPEEKLTGVVHGTVFRNAENGYSVLSVSVKGEEVNVVGVLPPLGDGENVTFYGGWVEHREYGRQWKASGCEVEEPTSLTDIYNYLSSGQIKGIGKATAELLVRTYKEKTFDVLLNMQELVKVKGIGATRSRRVMLKRAVELDTKVIEWEDIALKKLRDTGVEVKQLRAE